MSLPSYSLPSSPPVFVPSTKIRKALNTNTMLTLFHTESLRSYFSQFGKVDACTIMRDASGRSRGFAFLTFEDPAAVNAVMVREHFLDGKIVSRFYRASLRSIAHFVCTLDRPQKSYPENGACSHPKALCGRLGLNCYVRIHAGLFLTVS